jgi:hypothetical protein
MLARQSDKWPWDHRSRELRDFVSKLNADARTRVTGTRVHSHTHVAFMQAHAHVHTYTRAAISAAGSFIRECASS